MSVSVASYPSLVNTPLRGATARPPVRTTDATDLVAEAFSRSLGDMKMRLGPMLLGILPGALAGVVAGFGVYGALMVGALLYLIVLVGVGAAALFFSKELGDWGPSLVSGGLIAAYVVGLAPVLVMGGVVNVLLSGVGASYTRALAAAQRGEAEITLSASFSTFWHRLPTIALSSVVLTVTSLLLLGSVVGAPLLLAIRVLISPGLTMVILHDVGLTTALERTTRAVSADPRRHVGCHLLAAMLGTLLVAVPLVGGVWMVAFDLHLFRLLHGDPPRPAALRTT